MTPAGRPLPGVHTPLGGKPSESPGSGRIIQEFPRESERTDAQALRTIG